MKLYTRGGDKGMTSLIGGRVMKTDTKVEAYGTIDELNSFVGLAAAKAAAVEATQPLAEQLYDIMQELFDAGADLAYASPGHPYKLNEAAVSRLEQWIDEHTAAAPELSKFILPGGSELSAALHICRTVCRRAERRTVALLQQEEINQSVLAYLNRLSDYLFAAARAANVCLGVEDTQYIRSANVFKGKKQE
ncbi:Cob(I)yrinic acid a,c-diamide adenosyltransferase [Paenibacillus montaniterrae]|uniref:Corrinoid adenosyltransferase n=1 Tax=Paenibacillus montaniterrae TaxID=429341 RepID=A0A919YPP6_9BACL|nr:cob(I)yrinic acid a,c-diamide adenosyltransferase [Paenibacillus montaniterrae]GIP17037.1 Cob(I)yrinic acid a,c-diamide adenosyltransferase [Paenibacillus montaniterrae]